ncbi:GntR family transcriptional regulator [Corynebacterium pacaense]|uniref:GntR family transcriptional regulator n=1 Tax=Corynebacterium pacaense TaxID=1816684 RepID=UPI0009BA648F|nr:GntR family transcriptional regulator [Corynebacterium pacaense]
MDSRALPSDRPQAKGPIPVPLADETMTHLRNRIIDGTLTPGARLREAELADQLGVSRNTLREAFRMLSHEGLITQVPYSGAYVTTPTLTSIIDLYRVRRMIECQAIRQAFPKHPAVADMRSAVERAEKARSEDDWKMVGTTNIAFHDAIIALADSPRLTRIFTFLSAEMRLVFGLVDDPEYLHAPFLDLNREVLELVESGETEEAASVLDTYLVRAERLLLAAYERTPMGSGE